MNRLTYYLFLFFIHAFSYTPFRILYLFSDVVLYPFFTYVYRYRRNVILTNLSNSFPEKSGKEIRKIARGYYHHLCDQLVEGVKAFSLSEKQILARYKVMNPEVLDQKFRDKQSVIAVLGHYNNWEWGSIAAGLQLKHLPVALYKPLSNQLIDNYIEKTRAKSGTVLISIYHTTLTFKKFNKAPALFIMVADQNPAKADKAIWLPFLNQDTPVLNGPEKHARIGNLPVYYVKVDKVKRGYYTATFEALVEDPSSCQDHEITRRFMAALEAQISQKPEYWLWSHKRWKHKHV